MVIEYNFSIPTGSYLSKRLRFLKSTGLTLGLMQHMVRMYIRETPNSPTILLALNTDNGGAVTCAQDTFYPGSRAAFLFYDKGLNDQYIYRIKLPNGPWVFSPDGIIQLWAGAEQTAVWNSLKEVFYDLEIVPLKLAKLYGVSTSFRDYSLSGTKATDANTVVMNVGRSQAAATGGNAIDESDWRANISNDDSNDKRGWIILPARHIGYFQYFDRGGIVQIVNKSTAKADNVVPYADTVPRRILGAGTTYLGVTPAWPTLPELDERNEIAFKLIYTAPPIQITNSASAAVGYERMASSILDEDPESASELITNGAFASDLSGWDEEEMAAYGGTATIDDGECVISYGGYSTAVPMKYPVSGMLADTSYQISFTLSEFSASGTGGSTPNFNVALTSSSGTYWAGSQAIANGTYIKTIATPPDITPTGILIHFGGSGPGNVSVHLDNVSLVNASLNTFTLPTDWAYDGDNYCITKTASANVDAVLSQEVISTADIGKRMRIRILAGVIPADPHKTRMTALTVDTHTLTLTINGQSFVLGSAPYAWSQASIDVDFTVDADELDTAAKRSVSLVPNAAFPGSIFCLSVREVQSYGTVSVDADNGNDQCVLTTSLKPFKVRQISGDASSEIIQEGDVVYITDLRVDRGASTDATKTGLRKVVSVSDSVLTLEPNMSEGEYDDEDGLTDLVITKVDQNLAEQFVRGKISLIGPNVTREAEAWR